MSQSDQFWRYVEAAMLGAHKSKNEAEKRAFLDLAHILAQAALESEGATSAMAVWNSPVVSTPMPLRRHAAPLVPRAEILFRVLQASGRTTASRDRLSKSLNLELSLALVDC